MFLEKLFEWRFKIFRNCKFLSFEGKGLESRFCEIFRVVSCISLFIIGDKLFVNLFWVSLINERLERL